jgi:hypothetical protein
MSTGLLQDFTFISNFLKDVENVGKFHPAVMNRQQNTVSLKSNGMGPNL